MESNYNMPLLMKCFAVVVRRNKSTFEEAWKNFMAYSSVDENASDTYFKQWQYVVKFGALSQPSEKMMNALGNGYVLCVGVYARDPILVEIALLLGAQLGQFCSWTVCPNYPNSKCLLVNSSAYYSKESGAEELISMVDACLPCPFKCFN